VKIEKLDSVEELRDLEAELEPPPLEQVDQEV
jgi:hypothetical protein